MGRSIVEQYAYDPWGRRRNPVDWSFNNVPVPSLIQRGFTSHEHIDEMTLINMNGRIYDPVLGMFISCDNFVQSPTQSQNFNRYSYAMGNPLKFTDPDGNFFFIIAIGYALMQADIAGNASKNHGGNYWEGFGKSAGVSAAGMLVGAGVGSVVGGLFSTATSGLGSTLSGAASGALSGGITGGIMNAVMGGSFKSGFINGTIGGGLMGALGGYDNYKGQQQENAYFAREGVTFDSNGKIEYTTENAKILYRLRFKDKFLADEGLKDIHADGSDVSYQSVGGPADICYDAEKGIYDNDAMAVTISNKNTTLSEMYFGKAAFSSSKQLFLTMGHELNHVAMNFFGRPQSESFSYNWEVEACMVNHFTYNQMDIPMKLSIKKGWFSDMAKYPNFGINLNYSPY